MNPNTYFELHFPLHNQLAINLLYQHYKKLIKWAIHSVLITNSLIKVSTALLPLSVDTLSYIIRIVCLTNFPHLVPRIVSIRQSQKTTLSYQGHLVPRFIHQMYTHILQISWILPTFHNSNFHISSCLLPVLLGHLPGNTVCRIYFFLFIPMFSHNCRICPLIYVSTSNPFYTLIPY